MNTVVILAGGTGTRLGGGIPKQYIEVNGRPVIAWCMERFAECDAVDAVQIAADASWHDFIRHWMPDGGFQKKWKGFSTPGETRQLSVLHSLLDVTEYASPDSYVMVHDAARPLVKEESIRMCFEAAQGHDGVMPVLPVKDTVYFSTDGKKAESLLDRDRLFAGQAPEVFRLGPYLDANRALSAEQMRKIRGSSEPAVLAGLDIVMTEGDEENFKITTSKDLERFCREVCRRPGDWPGSGMCTETTGGQKDGYNGGRK